MKTLSLLFALGTAAAGAWTISWDASPDPAVLGYRVHVSRAPGVIVGGTANTVIAAGTATSVRLPEVPVGEVRYAVVTAYAAAAIESLPSAEVVWPTTTLVFHQLPAAQKYSVWEINAGEISGSLGMWQKSTEVPKIVTEPWGGIGPSGFVRWEFTVPVDRRLRFFKLQPTP